MPGGPASLPFAPPAQTRQPLHHHHLPGMSDACCHFHPGEPVVGVCALCLHERLLLLLASRPASARRRPFSAGTSRLIPRVLLAFLRPRKAPAAHAPPEDCCISSLEDSFISIKFGDDGRASWDKKHLKMETGLSQSRSRSMVEHAKPRGVLRWRKRVGQILQAIRGRRPSKQGPVLAEAGRRSGEERGVCRG